jgi:hypothetical protein
MSEGGMSQEGLSMAGLAEKRMVVVDSEQDNDQPDQTGDGFEGAPERRPEELRLLEALLFAASEPLDEKVLAERLPENVDVRATLRKLQAEYAPRGVNLVHIGKKWTFPRDLRRQGHNRRAARDRLDPPARTPQGAGAPAHLRHDRGISVAFRA